MSATEFDSLKELVDWAQNIVVLTGAGISTESGIPDFRSPGGIWEKFRIVEYPEYMASEEARIEDWARRFFMKDQVGEVEPNAGHQKIAEWISTEKCAGLITQNIDGLHQRAGVPDDKIIEIHGNATTASCTCCAQKYTMAECRNLFEASGESPKCTACGNIIKTDVVMFGQAMPAAETNAAFELAILADLFIVIGSSLVVQPAATLPLHAKRNGAKFAIINRDRTELDQFADCVVNDEIGAVMAGL